MQTAKHDGVRFDARDVEEAWARPISRTLGFACPGCDEPVWFVKGSQRVAHYRHRRRLPSCPFEPDSDYNPESDLHVRLKYALRDWAAEALAADFPGVQAEVEVRIGLPVVLEQKMSVTTIV